MIPIPSDKKKLLQLANDLVEQCRVSVPMRSSYYRTLNAIAETGRYDGTKSLINMMYVHLDRTAAHLFSPAELKFSIDFERIYPKQMLEKAAVVSKVLTRTWERNGTDTTFARGVFEALKYGGVVLKQWVQMEGATGDEAPVLYDKLVMPWQFGVYREDENRLDRQTAMCETVSLTLPEVWQRIWHLPTADKLYERIATHAKAGEASSDPNSFFHQVLSTSQLNTGVQGSTMPGGIVQLNSDPNYSIMGPVIAAGVVQMHEVWVKGDEHDYVTIQLIEPDILIAPLYKRSNLLGVPGQQPYRLIQPNEVTNWFWGRSELVDLIEPQALLSTWADDIKRLFGLQVDKLLGFIGEGGMTDELYGQARGAGYMNLGPNTKIEDLTPKFPPEAIPMLKFIMETMNQIGAEPDILRGSGESGVRAGVHADTLLRTGASTLRDRSLLVERQCAIAADLTLQILEAKDDSKFWLKADEPIKDVDATSFLLTDLPEDWRVTVDSHSASPIFSNETGQMIFQAAKSGIVTGEYVLDNLPFPNKEPAKAQLREKEKNQAEQFKVLMQNDPEVAAKALGKQLGGGRR